MSYIHHVYHIVFSTKGRDPMIIPDVRSALYSYIGGIIRDMKGRVLEVGGTMDHVHILAHLHQSRAVSDVIRDVKSGSARWMNEQTAMPRHFAWQKEYASFTVSASVVKKVQEYILNQEEHHRTVPFMEELVAFLDKHGVEYNEQYVGQ